MMQTPHAQPPRNRAVEGDGMALIGHGKREAAWPIKGKGQKPPLRGGVSETPFIIEQNVGFATHPCEKAQTAGTWGVRRLGRRPMERDNSLFSVSVNLPYASLLWPKILQELLDSDALKERRLSLLV